MAGLSHKPTSAFSEVKNDIQKFSDNGSTIFLHIGTCNAAKNQRMLIGAFNKIMANGNGAMLMIIGSGFDSEEGRKLKSLACDKIIFLGEKHNVSDYLLNADAFCLSSVREGMPISLIEAFACGCTPICTPIGGLINTIKNGETGYLSKSVSEDDYSFAIRDYLKNKNKIRKEDLIRYYSNNFSIEECARKYTALYKMEVTSSHYKEKYKIRNMKICFWGDIGKALSGNTSGGGELQIALLARALAKAGHEVVVS